MIPSEVTDILRESNRISDGVVSDSGIKQLINLASEAELSNKFYFLMFLVPWGNKMKGKAHLLIKEKQLILEGVKGISRGDTPGELKIQLTNMVTAMPTKG
jgi:hypothetical protein